MIISSCAGIHYKSALDLKRWNALFLSKGFVTTVVNTTSYPRKKNCGRKKTQTPSRGVKDIYDATRFISKVEGVSKNKIFVIPSTYPLFSTVCFVPNSKHNQGWHFFIVSIAPLRIGNSLPCVSIFIKQFEESFK